MRSYSISRQRRIAEALARRAALDGRMDLTAFRLFHGHAEGVPGLAVDRYAQVAVIHVESWSMLDEWLPALRASDIGSFDAAYTKVHPRTAGGLSAEDQRRLAPQEPAWGLRVDDVVVTEYGANYLVRPSAGLSVGLFLDMREVRRWLRQEARGRTVLNLFAYTCSFGVSGALGGATRVVNVDVSRPSLNWGKANYKLNGLVPETRDFIYGDAFDWLRRFGQREQRFDLVIVDPPSFSSTPFSVTQDYSRLVAAAARVVTPGGTLLAATNHAATPEPRFESWLARGLEQAGRRGAVIQRWHEPSVDFPVLRGGTPYLKVQAVELD